MSKFEILKVETELNMIMGQITTVNNSNRPNFEKFLKIKQIVENYQEWVNEEYEKTTKKTN